MSRSSPQAPAESDWTTAPGRVGATLPDFLGRTALPLLAALRTGARILFLVDARRAFVNRKAISESEFMWVPMASAERLPFGDRTFDCAVVDVAQLEAERDAATGAGGCEAILNEVRRVLCAGGELVLVAGLRRVPQDWRLLHRYRLVRPDRRWTAALETAGYQVAATTYAELDDQRLTALARSSRLQAGRSKRPGYKVLRCSQKIGEPPPTVLDTILENVAARLDAGVLNVQRIAIRKIGKTSITAADTHGRKYMIRVPRSAVAGARARRNQAALQAVASDERFPPSLRKLVPRHLLCARVLDYDCYVEECVAGSELKPSLPAGEIWHGEAVDFVTTLHTRSRYRAVVDEEIYQNCFSSPLATVRLHCGGTWANQIDRLAGSIRESVAGATLPLAWTHGDFFLGNCLSSSAGELTGVVDWELFSATGLPLLDLLQCMIVPGETSSHPTWQRFDRICSFLAAPSDLYRWPAVTKYLEVMEIPAGCVPALLRMYWVDHVANRIAARSSDPVWMRKRVYQPLRALDRIERSASISVAGRR